MIQRKCDRCMAVIGDEYKPFIKSEQDTEFGILRGKRHMPLTGDGFECVDLCDECKEKFVKWMESGRATEWNGFPEDKEPEESGDYDASYEAWKREREQERAQEEESMQWYGLNSLIWSDGSNGVMANKISELVTKMMKSAQDDEEDIEWSTLQFIFRPLPGEGAEKELRGLRGYLIGIKYKHVTEE